LITSDKKKSIQIEDCKWKKDKISLDALIISLGELIMHSGTKYSSGNSTKKRSYKKGMYHFITMAE